MTKRTWTIWADEYLGDDWNNRHKLFTTEGGIKEVEDTLLEQFKSDHRPFVDLDGDDEHIYAIVCVCLTCNLALDGCECRNPLWHSDRESDWPDLGIGCHSIGYHAIAEIGNGG